MRRLCIALGLVMMAGCYSVPGARELPAGHPADPGSKTTSFELEPNLFAATPTFLVPLAQAAGSSMPGMQMPGMEGGAGMSETQPGGEGQQPGSAPAEGAQYTCPMHPEVVQPTPGACPKCGMKLRPMEPHPHEKKDPDQ